MGVPVVAIVGRPNVGKSSLFNALSGRRTAIVEPTPGVTRDRISTICDYDEVYFELVDTGGYGIEDRDQLTEHIERQIHYAIEQAHSILFVVDNRDGIVPLDQRMATLLRKHHDRVRLVANKVDLPTMSAQASEFERLGFGEPLCVSAVHGFGKGELKEYIVERVREAADTVPEDPIMKCAIVGKRNAGKSTFINALAGAERVIVSEVPGTTRDAVDVRFEKDGRTILAIDTAGVRKKSRLADSIEFYALNRAQLSIRRADVVLLILDAPLKVGHVEKKLAGFLIESYKPVVIVVNKWDLAKGKTSTEEYGEYLNKVLPGLGHAPVVFVSAIDSHNVIAAIDTASSLFKQHNTRISTSQLNQVLATALADRRPTARRGARAPRVFYGTQVATRPPTIVLFVNRPSYFRDDFLRYLLNRLREELPMGEIPIRLVLRPRRPETKSKR